MADKPINLVHGTLTQAQVDVSTIVLRLGQSCLTSDTRRQYDGDDVSTLAQLGAAGKYLIPNLEVVALLGPIDAALQQEILDRAQADTDLGDDIAAEAGTRASEDAATLDAANDYTDTQIAGEVSNRNSAIAAAVVGLYDNRGTWDASGGLYPATSGSGTAGAVLKGDTWRISVAGMGYDAGDSISAEVDTPGQTAGNWGTWEHNVAQATEAYRGAAAIATQAEVEDAASVNDEDVVSVKKWWIAFAKGLTIASFLAAVRGTLLAGYTAGSDTAIAATDSILEAFRKVQAQITAHRSDTANPHSVTKTQVGLSNVDNTSDVNKPVSTAQAAADAAVQSAASSDATTKANAAQATAIAASEPVGNTRRTVLGSDFPTSSATAVDVTGLNITIPAGETWAVKIMGAYQSTNVNTGAAVSITRTGSPTRCIFERRIFTAAGTFSSSGSVGTADDVGITANTTVDGANTDRSFTMLGLVKAGASDCVIQVRTIRGGSANNIKIMTGSYILAHKLS